jgi:hypothetical protein
MDKIKELPPWRYGYSRCRFGYAMVGSYYEFNCKEAQKTGEPIPWRATNAILDRLVDEMTGKETKGPRLVQVKKGI